MSEEQNTPEPQPGSRYYEMFVETLKQFKEANKYPCDKCAAIFTNTTLLKRHMNIYHKNSSSITQLFQYHCNSVKCVLCRKDICASSGINKIKKHLSETHKQTSITIKIKCSQCSSSFGNCVQASNHYKKYHGVIKNNPPARNPTAVGKKVQNTISNDSLAPPSNNQPADPTTSPIDPILEETRKELQLFSKPEPLANLPIDSPIPISPDTPTIPFMSPSDDVNIAVDNNSNKEPLQKEDDKELTETEEEEEEEEIIKSFRGLLKRAGMYCTICNKRTDSKTTNSLQRHMKRFHPNIINKEGSLDVHLSYPFKDKFNRPICKKDYQFHGFKRHSKTMHPNHIFNLIISCSVCQLEFSNPRVAINHFTTHKGSHKKKDDTGKAPNFKNLLNYSDANNEFNLENIEEGNEGVSNMSRLHPVADLNDPFSLSPITSSPPELSDPILPSLSQLNP